MTFLAFDEMGRPIGVATAFVSPLRLEFAAASTLPDHRGRGAYRALVYGRWLEADRRLGRFDSCAAPLRGKTGG